MLTADDVLAAVRVHADRMHDAARRLGCGPEAAARVVASASLDLVDAVARQPDSVPDPVGWLFARVRTLGRAAAGGDDTLPVGSGVLSSDGNQVRLAEALEARPERERAALLLRDSYDLPLSAVATALAMDQAAAMEVVGTARLSFLPGITGTAAPVVPEHAQLTALARLSEGGPAAQREVTTRRHAQSCDRCAAVLDAQERARRLLSGLTVVALPDAERDQLLKRLATRAQAVLPAAPAATEDAEWEEEPRRRYSLSLMALGLVLAVGLGTGVGALTSRGGSGATVAEQRPLPLVTAAPVITVRPLVPTSTRRPGTSPSPHVFLVTPSPTPTPTVTATPTPTSTQSADLTLQLDPSSGPMETQITVTGQGWDPGSEVTLHFVNRVGQGVGSTGSAVVDAEGTFTGTLIAHDGVTNVAGERTVTADEGSDHQEAVFTVTG